MINHTLNSRINYTIIVFMYRNKIQGIIFETTVKSAKLQNLMSSTIPAICMVMYNNNISHLICSVYFMQNTKSHTLDN